MNSIEIHDVSKRFMIHHERADSLKERVVRGRRRVNKLRQDDFWALRNISLEIEQGETVGLLGHNGSGKSTLLKCVAGILEPTSGSIATYGRVAALLELGAGFHPDLSGRENVYLNGSILGLSRSAVDRIFDDVVGFAELEGFIDNQVKHYSSGMYARLAFAVAVNVDPEVLLVDEVLAVGDEQFQRKCIDRIKQFQRQGVTMLFVTHAADLAREICDRVAVLDRGALVRVGTPAEAILTFRDSLLQRGIARADLRDIDEVVASAVRIADVAVEYCGKSATHAETEDPVRVHVVLASDEPVSDVVVALTIRDRKGNLVMSTNTRHLQRTVGPMCGTAEVVFELGRVPLLDGVYEVAVGVHTIGGIEYDHRAGQDFIEMLNPSKTIGLVNLAPSVVEVRHAGTAAQR